MSLRKRLEELVIGTDGADGPKNDVTAPGELCPFVNLDCVQKRVLFQMRVDGELILSRIHVLKSRKVVSASFVPA